MSKAMLKFGQSIFFFINQHQSGYIHSCHFIDIMKSFITVSSWVFKYKSKLKCLCFILKCPDRLEYYEEILEINFIIKEQS